MSVVQSERDPWPFGGVLALWRVMTSCEGLTWIALAAGFAFRVQEYADNRGLYLDEVSLFQNLVRRSIFDFRTLADHQLAPPGFLVIERLMVRLPMNREFAARLLPLVFSLASLFLFRAVARRYLVRTAVPLAMAFFALSDYLAYYAAEIKQYSLDVTLTLTALLLATRSSPPKARRWAVLGAFGTAAVWFSHPIAFALGGLGFYEILSAAIAKRPRDMLLGVAVSTGWAASFTACFLVSHHLLDKDSFMWDWWNFAFLRIPPRSAAEAIRVSLQLINVFINPGWIVTPLGFKFSACLATGLFLAGAVALGKRWRGGLFLLMAPIFFALLASILHKYPFHGRLLLFLLPTIYLLVAEGTMVIGRRTGPVVLTVLIVLLLFRPVTDPLWQRSITRRTGGPDSHGDLHFDLLDEIDRNAAEEVYQPPRNVRG